MRLGGRGVGARPLPVFRPAGGTERRVSGRGWETCLLQGADAVKRFAIPIALLFSLLGPGFPTALAESVARGEPLPPVRLRDRAKTRTPDPREREPEPTRG